MSVENVSKRSQIAESFTKKYELKRQVVFLQINNLRDKLANDDGSWPKKTKRRIETLERLERCSTYNHSVEIRVLEALRRCGF